MEGSRIKTLKETGEGEARCSPYSGTEMVDAQVGG